MVTGLYDSCRGRQALHSSPRHSFLNLSSLSVQGVFLLSLACLPSGFRAGSRPARPCASSFEGEPDPGLKSTAPHAWHVIYDALTCCPENGSHAGRGRASRHSIALCSVAMCCLGIRWQGQKFLHDTGVAETFDQLRILGE